VAKLLRAHGGCLGAS